MAPLPGRSLPTGLTEKRPPSAPLRPASPGSSAAIVWGSVGDSCLAAVNSSPPEGVPGTVPSLLLLGSHLHELLLLGNEGTVSSGGSTVDVVRATVPVGIGAASSGA